MKALDLDNEITYNAVLINVSRSFVTAIYKEYIWKNGKPYGLKNEGGETKEGFKIVADPYYKRISIEKYIEGAFYGVIYDSALFDFRHLKPAEQNAWQKNTVLETSDKTICHIRNQDDRLILIEEYYFEANLCRQCLSYSPHRLLISTQKIHYRHLNDPYNGATLYDCNNRPVMYKTYEIDPQTFEFAELISEEWDMSKQDISMKRLQ